MTGFSRWTARFTISARSGRRTGPAGLTSGKAVTLPGRSRCRRLAGPVDYLSGQVPTDVWGPVWRGERQSTARGTAVMLERLQSPQVVRSRLLDGGAPPAGPTR